MNARLTFALAAACAMCAPLPAQVTFDRILHADREPQNWMSTGRDYAEDRFSLVPIPTLQRETLIRERSGPNIYGVIRRSLSD